MKDRHTAFKCICDCGKEVVVSGNSLKAGLTKSCGCLSSDFTAAKNYIHGYNKREAVCPEYRAYTNAKQRCSNPNVPGYSYYGGRGIKFLLPPFPEFLEHIGERPSSKHSLDRIKAEGNYEIGNIRWATREVQASNKRRCNDLSSRIRELECENLELRKKLKECTCQYQPSSKEAQPSR